MVESVAVHGVVAGGLLHQRTAVLGGKNTEPLTELDSNLQVVIGVLGEYELTFFACISSLVTDWLLHPSVSRSLRFRLVLPRRKRWT